MPWWYRNGEQLDTGFRKSQSIIKGGKGLDHREGNRKGDEIGWNSEIKFQLVIYRKKEKKTVRFYICIGIQFQNKNK